MRIVLTVRRLPPDSLGGVEVYTRGLARALTALGHEAYVFVPAADVSDAPELRSSDDFVRVQPQGSAQAGENPLAQFWHTVRNRALERAFARLLHDIRPHVVHFQQVQGVSARLIRQAAGRPRVVTLHDYWYFCANSQLRRPGDEPCAGPSAGCRNCVDCMTLRPDLLPLRTLRPITALPLAARNGYLRRALQGVDLFIAPSEFLRRQYIGQGFPAERIFTLENGIDGDPPCEEESPVDMMRDAARPRFLYVGALAHHKGVHLLVEAFNKAPPHASLTIVGDDALFPGYAADLHARARHPNVRFLGARTQSAVHAAMREADCLVVPSIWYENSPLVIQEAYAAGVPVIASRIGALTEKVADGVTGRLFEAGSVEALADLLCALADDPAQLAAMRVQIQPPPAMMDHAALLASLYGGLAAENLHPNAGPA